VSNLVFNNNGKLNVLENVRVTSVSRNELFLQMQFSELIIPSISMLLK
jgi:hypothetical protein